MYSTTHWESCNQCNNLKKVYLPDGIIDVGDATEKANMKCNFIYRDETFYFEKLKERISHES